MCARSRCVMTRALCRFNIDGCELSGLVQEERDLRDFLASGRTLRIS